MSHVPVGDLYFPCESELITSHDVRRQTRIPVTFSDVNVYKRSLVGAIKGGLIKGFLRNVSLSIL